MTVAAARLALLATCVFAYSAKLLAVEKPPRAIDDRLKIELFAEHPDIVTPTGIDVDHTGRVWAIESNTHFPPAGYKGHPSDRILVMQDTTGDLKADKITVFADGLKHTMSIAVKPIWLNQPTAQASDRDKPGARPTSWSDVFIATRRAIWLFTDTNGDLKADNKKRIIQLDTKGDYPHNGLAGFAFDAMGWMYFGFGENLGADYKIIGSDGTTLKGGGEGGNLYRCRPDGSKLKQWATGFWNPHASCVDAFGRLFTVDNDPDSRPPCRLLHIIEGGDYGFRFRNGRKGLHPFTAWNGEIPGTLPMVSGTGEAPSGIVAYESDGLPKDYIGNLLVGSWGDHRIDRFRLKPRGASFESLPETIIQGGEDFRPVGLAVAPDGSLFLTDWVKRDYKLHGHGRVWRVSLKEEVRREVIELKKLTPSRPLKELKELLQSPRLNVRRQAATSLGTSKQGVTELYEIGRRSNAETRRVYWECLWAFQQSNFQSEYKLGKLRSASIRNPPRGVADNISGIPAAVIDLAAAVLRAHIESNTVAKCATVNLCDDPFLATRLRRSLARSLSKDDLVSLLDEEQNPMTNLRLVSLLAARSIDARKGPFVELGLKDPSPAVRRIAVQWIAEENLKDLRPQVEAILNSETMTTDLFLATLAALEMLDGKNPKDFDKTPAGKYVLPLVKDETRSPAVRAQALRLVDENDAALDAKLMQSLLAQENAALQLEAVRSLQHSTAPYVGELLAAVAVDEKRPLQTRAEAVVGLAGRSYFPKRNAAVIEALDQLRKDDKTTLQIEALRSLRKVLTKTAKGRGIRLALLRRFAEAAKQNPDALNQGGSHRALAEQLALVLTHEKIEIPEILQSVQSERPQKPGSWYERLETDKGDPAAGRRVFFHSQGAGCYRCHTVNGRGEHIGPDLSHIGGGFNRKRLIESILEPSKEIAPQFISWTFLMESGKVHTGMILGDTRNNKQRIGTPAGTVIELNAPEIEERHPQQKSLMPDDLHKQLTVSEFRDLLAYLESLK